MKEWSHYSHPQVDGVGVVPDRIADFRGFFLLTPKKSPFERILTGYEPYFSKLTHDLPVVEGQL